MRASHVLVLHLFHLGCCIQIFEWQRDWGDGIFSRELAQVLPEVMQIIHSATESNVPSNVPVISLYHYDSDFVEFTNGLMIIRPLLSEDHQICFIGQISSHWSSDYNSLQYRHGATIASNIQEIYDLDLDFPGNFDPLALTSVTDFCGVDRSHLFYLKKTSNFLPNTTVLNIQGLFRGYAVMVTEEVEHLIFVPPLSRYSKLLVTASCEYEKGQGHSTSHYCPGYSDAKVTPYDGIKTEKLAKMAEVFCSHCTSEDFICKRLFCLPDILIVNITQTALGSFCEAIETDFPACHSEFCTSPLSRRGVKRSDSGYPLSSNLNGQLSCQASLSWAWVAGMNSWCKSNCVNGYDGVTCTEEYCDCSAPQTTTTASVVGNQPIDVCTEWEANPTYAGTAGIDNWCQNRCSSGSCPLSHCQCKANTAPTATAMSSQTTTARPTTISSPMTTTRTTSKSLPTTTERIPTSSPTTTARQTTSSSKTTERTTTTSLPTTTERTTTKLSQTPSARTASTLLPTTSASQTTSSPRTTEKITSSTTSARPTTSPTPTEKTTTQSLPRTTTGTKTPTTTERTTPITTTGTTTPTTTGTSTTKITTTTTGTTPTTTTRTTTTTAQTTATGTTPTTNTGITPTTTTGTPLTTPASTTGRKPTAPTITSTGTTPAGETTPLTADTGTTTTTTVETRTTTRRTERTTRTTVSPTSSIPATSVSSASGSATMSTPVSTSSSIAINVTDEDSFSIVDQIVCDHAKFQGQNMVTARFCHREGQGQNEAAGDKTGFSKDIMDQVLSFAPKILCSLTSGSARTDTCTNMFCGESPLSQRVIRTAMCSVCQMFIADGYTDCLNTYC